MAVDHLHICFFGKYEGVTLFLGVHRPSDYLIAARCDELYQTANTQYIQCVNDVH